MSFQVITKEELVKALEEKGIHSHFFDLHAIDVAATCHYFTVLDDVKAGCYTFEVFIAAHKKLEDTKALYSIGEVRLLSQEMFHQKANSVRRDVETKIREGAIT